MKINTINIMFRGQLFTKSLLVPVEESAVQQIIKEVGVMMDKKTHEYKCLENRLRNKSLPVGDRMKHYAFDLDDTLINTGETILRFLEAAGYPINDVREPYNSLRWLKDNRIITPEDLEYIMAYCSDTAEPIPSVVRLLKDTINLYGEAHIVSTRSHINPTETLNILGKILSWDELLCIKLHWAKAPDGNVQRALADQGISDAKLYWFRELVNLGITHFIDDLGFNIATIIESVPGLQPIWLLQPWTIDGKYKPEYLNNPIVEFMEL